jgi:NTP pyrophosphatase (non-canonical NTP hydrolase)
MNLNDYQKAADDTDQTPRSSSAPSDGGAPRSEVIPLLGLVGEVGSLLGEYKKLLRDGETHRSFREEVSEELGDILWYVANVATKHGLALNDIATQNISKVRDRWSNANGHSFPDEIDPPDQRLPRHFEYELKVLGNGVDSRIQMYDRVAQRVLGDPLSDNAYEDNGYRFHDVMHLAFACRLGWSPVLRKLLRRSGLTNRRIRSRIDEVEDGGRAQVIDEAIVACAYAYASRHAFLAGTHTVDWTLLKQIKSLTTGLEIANCSAKQWNDTLKAGFVAWDALREAGGGIVVGDAETGRLDVRELTG